MSLDVDAFLVFSFGLKNHKIWISFVAFQFRASKPYHLSAIAHRKRYVCMAMYVWLRTNGYVCIPMYIWL